MPGSASILHPFDVKDFIRHRKARGKKRANEHPKVMSEAVTELKRNKAVKTSSRHWEHQTSVWSHPSSELKKTYPQHTIV